MDAAIKKFQKSIGVNPVKMSSIVDVTYEAGNPIDASKVLDTLIHVYLAMHTEAYASGKQEGYEQVIGQDMADLERLEHEQTRIRLDNQLYDIAAQRAALIQQRVDAQAHFNDVIDRKVTLEQRIGALSKSQAAVPSTTVSSETDQRFQGGVKTIVQPNLLAQQVKQELIMDQVELAPLADEVTRYRSLIAGHGHELDRLERADTELRLNKAHIDNIQANLQALRQRLDQARTEDELDQARMTSVVQVSPALTPDKPASPKPLTFMAAGMACGLLAAGGVIGLAIVTRGTVYTEIGLERQFGLPVLASVDLIAERTDRKSAVPK